MVQEFQLGSFGQVATNTILLLIRLVPLTVKENISLNPTTTNNSIGISEVGAGSGNYFVDYYNYQGGDAYIKLRTASSGTGRPYIQLEIRQVKNITQWLLVMVLMLITFNSYLFK